MKITTKKDELFNHNRNLCQMPTHRDMQNNDLIPHLFRTEFRKITSVLCKYLGTEYIEIAEDLTSETFSLALETWPYKGIPENPAAWLYTVAKNKAKNQVHRQQIFTQKIVSDLWETADKTEETDIDLSEENITDSQLQMLFTICHPSLSTEAQICLSLRILCGLGITEIANALLSNKGTINKRLVRAREKLRQEKVKIELPSTAAINQRLETVLTTLYLLFNEGYYSESNNSIVREDLCLEAMRLTYMLIENEHTNQPQVNALIALMCFHASRFEARKNDNGEIVLYEEQDETLWNTELITRGAFYMHEAAQGNNLSKYHLEANIAYWMTQKSDTKEKWETVLQLYNQLLQIEYSPIAALNRTYALAKANGVHGAIAEAEKLRLTNNPFYFNLLGELYKNIDKAKALQYLHMALTLAKTETEKRTIQKKIEVLSD